MTDRIIPLPDGRFSVSREDLKLARDWGLETAGNYGLEDDEAGLLNAIDAALNKDTTDAD